MTEKNEQWRAGGNCSLCRREAYCSKPCTTNKKAVRSWIHRQIVEKTGLDAEAIGGIK